MVWNLLATRIHQIGNVPCFDRPPTFQLDIRLWVSSKGLDSHLSDLRIRFAYNSHYVAHTTDHRGRAFFHWFRRRFLPYQLWQHPKRPHRPASQSWSPGGTQSLHRRRFKYVESFSTNPDMAYLT